MKRFFVITALILVMCLFTGCQTEKAAADSSAGASASPVPAASEAAAEAEAAEEQPAEEPAAEEQEPVMLTYEGETARACVDSIYFDEDGRLAVVIAGQGYGFNKILPIRNGRIVMPFYADIRTAGTVHSWDSASISEGAITYLFDVAQLPEEVILYSADNKDEQFVFDAAPYILDEPPMPEQAGAEGYGLSELAGRWAGTGKPSGGGETIDLKLDLSEDGTGTYWFRQGDYSESYPVSVNEGDGTFSADIPADNYLRIVSCKGTYEYDGSALMLHIITEFASGGKFEYDVACERAD